MAVALGKDCTISVGGTALGAVRSVTWVQSAKEVEVHPFGTKSVCKWSCGYEASVDIEFIEDPGYGGMLGTGETVSISGSGYSGTFVITNIARSEPLDDVVTVVVTAKVAIQNPGMS